MIIENPDALKIWLTGYLPPLCDADPEVLAKYCLALVRKDRPNNELKASMIEQLDVFLKTNTETFVEKFLEVAKSKSYLPKVLPTLVAPSTTIGPNSLNHSGNSPDSTTAIIVSAAIQTQVPSPKPNATVTTTIISAVDPPLPPLPPLPPPVPAVPHPPPETTPPYPPKKDEVSSSVKPKKPDSDREKEDRRGKTRSRGDSRSRSRDKTRSRSRDRERNRRSRSRGRTRSKYDDRRRRSPHVKRFRRSRTRSRSPRWSRSPNRRSRSRERRSRSRNRSRSASQKKHQPRHKSRSPLISSHPNSPTSRISPSNDDKEKSPSPDTGNESSAIVHSVVTIPPNQDSYSATKSQRCRDYDVQGFCMRGDQCPFDHGADRVVLEGGAIDFPPPLQVAPPISGVRYPVPGLHNASMPQDISGRSFLCHPPPARPSEFGEYTPSNPGLWGSDILPPSNPYFGGRGRGISGPPPRFPGPPPSLPMPLIDRALINVIPVNGSDQSKAGIRPSLAQRLGPAANRPPPSISNFPERTGALPSANKYGSHTERGCTLELRKIPSGLNSITHLNQHFSKFGTITNIQVHHAMDPEAALVTFSSYSEANAAIRSTEAVLNNRFIKLFWHNGAKPDAANAALMAQRSVHERLGLRNPNKSLVNKAPAADTGSTMDDNEKVVVSRGSLVKTVYNASALRAAASHTETEGETLAQDIQSTSPKSQTSVCVVGAPLVQPETVEPPPSKPQLTTVEIKKQEIESILRQQELLKAEIASRQKAEKQKTEALRLKVEVELRTRQLLKEQMQHVKLLINKLEKNKSTMKPEEIRTLMETIKSLQAAVENTKTQLVATTTTNSSNTVTQIKTKPQLDKEILDSELELYNLQSEGRDIAHVRARLRQLKAHSAVLRGKHSKSYPSSAQLTPSLGPKPVPYSAVPVYPSVPRGRGTPRILRGSRIRGRGRGYAGNMIAVDRRTTCINASGFEREDKDQVLAHFESIGTVSNYSWDDLTPAICVQYATRKEAEKSVTEGRTLGDRLLTITWVAEPACFANPQLPLTEAEPLTSASTSLKSPDPGSTTIRSTTPHSTASIISNEDMEEITEEIVEEVTEEIGSFIFEDEIDEEEEEGGRSWRR